MVKFRKTVIHTSVFRNGPNGGNPCSLVLDGDDLNAEQGKQLASTFGAETVIILNPKEPNSDFGLRYFVPKYEMEMCVHGTIAATTVLKKMGRISKAPVKIETVLGQITVEWKDEGGELRVTVFQFPARFSDLNPTAKEVCSALRIPATAIVQEQGPIVSVSTSRSKLIVPIASTDVLDRIAPDFEMLWSLCDQYDTTGFYPFAEDPTGAPGYFMARQFPKRAGYNEDPATGVAACALGAYLTKYGSYSSGWHYFYVHQGQAMGKPSLLEVGAYLEKEHINKTCVSGKACILKEEALTPLSI
jgi:PhzF family phenazine biosynthesis protein